MNIFLDHLQTVSTGFLFLTQEITCVHYPVFTSLQFGGALSDVKHVTEHKLTPVGRDWQGATWWLKLFSGKTRRGTLGNGVWTFSAVFCSHMNNGRREILISDTFTAANQPQDSADKRQDVTYSFCCWDHMFLFTAHEHRHQLLSPQTFLTSTSVSSTCVAQLFHLVIFLFFHCCFCCLFTHVPPLEKLQRISGVQSKSSFFPPDKTLLNHLLTYNKTYH